MDFGSWVWLEKDNAVLGRLKKRRNNRKFSDNEEESAEMEKRDAANDAEAAKLQSMMRQLLAQMPKRVPMSPSR